MTDIVWQSIDDNLNHLSAYLGGCDRLASTPIPFAYSLILHRTVYLFCTLLPFALVADLHPMTPLVSVFISYTFCRWSRWRRSWKIRSAPRPITCRWMRCA